MIRAWCLFLLFVFCFWSLALAEDFLRDGSLFGFGNFVQLNNQALSGTGLKLVESRVRCGAECAVSCLEDSRCRSYNLAVQAASGGLLCQLLNADQFSSSTSMTTSQEFHHFTITTPCLQFPCKNGAQCQPDYSTGGYRCICAPGYGGVHCVTALTSCKLVKEHNPSAASGAYNLRSSSNNLYETYCYFGSLGSCPSNSWTLVMKLDGTKPTFTYDSAYWSNQNTYQSSSARNGFDNTETKAASYWSTKLNKLCLGMRYGSTTKWIQAPISGSSLHALISPGQHRPLSVPDRDTWKSLIVGSSLQLHCNRRGINSCGSTTCVRIGIISNQENDCNSPDSRIGYGCKGDICYQDNSNSCGNVARCGPDNGDTDIKAIGYILVGE